MKRKITLSKVLIDIIVFCIGTLIGYHCFKPSELKGKKLPDNIEHICTDPYHLTCDGNCECDGLGCSSGINPDDSLIADETYIVTDTIGIGYTLNQEIANILIDQGCKINYIDGDYIWFSFKQFPIIP